MSPGARVLALAVCTSDRTGDSTHSSCASWCKVDNRQYHCSFCKCDFCPFCSHRGVLPVAPKRAPDVICPTAVPNSALRLIACGNELRQTDNGQPVLLAGINFFLEWMLHSHPDYHPAAHPDVSSGTSSNDLREMRARVPAANMVRFVGVLWKDSLPERASVDGMECSNDDASTGFLDPRCLAKMDAFVRGQPTYSPCAL